MCQPVCPYIFDLIGSQLQYRVCCMYKVSDSTLDYAIPVLRFSKTVLVAVGSALKGQHWLLSCPCDNYIRNEMQRVTESFKNLFHSFLKGIRRQHFSFIVYSKTVSKYSILAGFGITWFRIILDPPFCTPTSPIYFLFKNLINILY